MDEITAPSIQSKQIQVKIPCVHAPGLTVGNRSRELECCKEGVDSYTLGRARGEAFLTRFLENLQSWNCPQFESQCNNRTMAFTPFAKLVYARFCNQTELLQKCKVKLSPSNREEIITSSNMSSVDEWKQLVSNQATPNLDDPCTQIALYEQTTFNDYEEILEVMIPLCDMAHCGYDIRTIAKHDLTAWTCMPTSCRANLVIAMVVIAMLAVGVTIANLTVLLVLTNHQPLRNSQAHYKLSLVVADLMVGILIFPTCLVSISKIFMQSRVISETTEVQGYNASVAWNYSNVKQLELTTVMVRSVGQSFSTNFPKSYKNFVGFMATISLLVSIRTLMLASVDRLWAIAFPLNFHKGNSITFSKYAVTTLWVFAVLFGILPLFVPGMQYVLVVSILVSFGGRNALVLYFVSFIIPLVLVWSTTIATYCIARKHSKIRRKIMFRHGNAKDETENRLLKTLSVMALAFSSRLLPAAILLVSMFMTNIYFTFPRLLDTTATKFYFSVEYVTVITLLTNSLWNCFIYSLRNREFAQIAKTLYSRAVLKAFCSDTEADDHKKRKCFRSCSCITLTTDTIRPSVPTKSHSSKDSRVV
ncbi:LOW QUALITY PROTEIN: uncharacterized protein LOC144747708 [Ciona intestinalis]